MTEHKLTRKEDILAFLLAGRAQFTIKSLRTGDHLTFKIKKAPSGDVYFVFGGKQPFAVGRLRKEDDGQFRFYPNKFGDAQYILAFHWTFLHLGDPQAEFFHIGKCGKCGRILSDPESIARGIGPECAKSVNRSVDVMEMF